MKYNKVTDKVRREILLAIEKGMTRAEIAKVMPHSYSTICRIVNEVYGSSYKKADRNTTTVKVADVTTRLKEGQMELPLKAKRERKYSVPVPPPPPKYLRSEPVLEPERPESDDLWRNGVTTGVVITLGVVSVITMLVVVITQFFGG